jgi:VCBS repeat-containing protein
LNHIATTISGVQKKDASGTLQLQVSASGLWSYHFGDAQKTTFARLIAGQKADQAVTTLLQQPGVHTAKVDLSLAYDNTLPGNPRQITIVWQPSS